MSIASAFNEITVAQGGTASKSGSIAGAIDKLNDVLAGSDQPGAETIEQAIRLLGQHIGGGGGTEYAIHCATLDGDTGTVTEISNCAYKGVYSSENASYVPDTTTGLINKAKPGEIVVLSSDGTYANINPVVIVGDSSVLSDLDSSRLYLSVDNGVVGWCPMPSSDAWFVTVS